MVTDSLQFQDAEKTGSFVVLEVSGGPRPVQLMAAAASSWVSAEPCGETRRSHLTRSASAP